MTETFIDGFVKVAVEAGLPDKTIARIFKLAIADTGMFKTPMDAPMQPQPPVNPMMQQNPQQLALLQQMLAQRQMAQPQQPMQL